MNPDKKKMWIDALLSGEYEQGKGALKTSQGYCCYGVLCEVAIKDGLDLVVSGDKKYDTVRYGDSTTTIPTQVAKWAGLDKYNPNTDIPVGDVDPYLVGNGASGLATFATLNDYGYTFEEIVPVIERVL
jgi:hypothetical protein